MIHFLTYAGRNRPDCYVEYGNFKQFYYGGEIETSWSV